MNFASTINKKNCFNLYIDYYIYILLLLYVIVDCLTGIAKIRGIPSPAVPYRMFLMILMTLSIGMKSQQNIKSQVNFLFLLYLYTVILFCSFNYLFGYNVVFTDSVSMLLRIILAPIMYLYIKETYSTCYDGKKYIENIINVNLLVFCINMILGLIGFGVNTYTDRGGVGIKGFIHDGNAFSGVIFCMFVYYFATREKKKKIILFFIIIGLLLGTKVSSLSILLYLIFFNIVNKRKRDILIIIFFISLFFYILYINGVFDYQIERIQWLYTLFEGNMVSVILSGRNIDLVHHYMYYMENFSLQQFLFGYGYLSNMKIIELDFFDTLFSYGILFLIPILSFYIYIIIKNRHNKMLYIFNIIYFLISLTSGHIWYNTSSALFFGIINSCLVNNKSIFYNNIRSRQYEILKILFK